MRPIMLTAAAPGRIRVYVNPDHIRFFQADPNGGTVIDFGHESLSVFVRESPSQIEGLLSEVEP